MVQTMLYIYPTHDLIFYLSVNVQVQAEWTKVDELGFNFIIDVKELVIWKTNPVSGYALSGHYKLFVYMH